MTMKNRQFATRVVIGAVSAVMAAVGCSEYPAELAGPPPLTTNSLPGPASVGAGGEAASALDEEDDDEYSYSQGAPVFSTAAVEDGAAGYWTWVYPEKCVKYRVLNRTVQFQTCEEQMVKVWVPAPAPTRGTTPKPSPSPSPIASPKLPSGAKPSVKPQGEGVFWFRVKRYLSPNGDGRKDTARIDVVATPETGDWILEIEGASGYVLHGNGSRLNYPWAGTVSGVRLGEGRHKLRLRSLSSATPIQTAECILDVTPPSVEKHLLDGQEKSVSDSVAPEFTIQVKDELAGLDKTQKDLTFSTRRDGVDPKVSTETIRYELDSPNRGRLVYQVPFEETSILYFGDQSVDFTLYDKAGNKADSQYLFAIGDHDLYSGIPPLDKAYKILRTPVKVKPAPEGPPEAERIEPGPPEGVDGKRFKVDPRNLLGDLAKKTEALKFPPSFYLKYVYVIDTAATLGKVARGPMLAALDLTSDSNLAFILASNTYLVKLPNAGNVVADPETWKQLEKSSGTAQTKATAIVKSFAELHRRKREYEIWKTLTPNDKIAHIANGKEGFLIYKNEAGRNLYFKLQGTEKIGARAMDWPLNQVEWTKSTPLIGNKFWPETATEAQVQWGYAARHILKYEPDLPNAEKDRCIFGWNLIPKFPVHVAGEIQDSEKPYEFGGVLVDGDMVNRGATHRYRKEVALLEPNFESHEGQHSHWNKHGTGKESQFASMPQEEYVRRAREIIRNGVRTDAGPASKYLKVHAVKGADPEHPRGRVFIYNSSTNEFLSIGEEIEGYIKTYFPPENREAYWREMLKK
jgi:hypothetical protein